MSATTKPKKGDRVNIYEDPYTRERFLGKGTVRDFITQSGHYDGEAYWLCEVILDDADAGGNLDRSVGTSFAFSNQDLIKEGR